MKFGVSHVFPHVNQEDFQFFHRPAQASREQRKADP